LLVFNKIDQLDRASSVERDPYGTIRAVFVSAATGLGLENLRDALAQRLLPMRDLGAPSAESIARMGATA
jgi:GTP-binding protein HflX